MPGIHFEDEAQMFAYKAWDTLKLEPPCNLDIVAQRLGLEIHTREFEEGIDGIYLRLPGAPPIIAINNLYVKPHARKRIHSCS